MTPVFRLSLSVPGPPAAGFPEEAVLLFHRWIQEDRMSPDLMIDVANYTHVRGGPGVLLLGHGVGVGLAGTPGGLRLTATRQDRRRGGTAGLLRAVLDTLLLAARGLAGESPVRFRPDHISLTVLDRLAGFGDDAGLEAHLAAAVDAAIPGGGPLSPAAPAPGGPRSWRIAIPEASEAWPEGFPPSAG